MLTLGETIQRLLREAEEVPAGIEAILQATSRLHGAVTAYGSRSRAGLETLDARAATLNVSLQRVAETTGSRGASLEQARLRLVDETEVLKKATTQASLDLQAQAGRGKQHQQELSDSLGKLGELVQSAEERAQSLRSSGKRATEAGTRLSETLASATQALAAFTQTASNERGHNQRAEEAAAQELDKIGKLQMAGVDEHGQAVSKLLQGHDQAVRARLATLEATSAALGTRSRDELSGPVTRTGEQARALSEHGLTPLSQLAGDGELEKRYSEMQVGAAALEQAPALAPMIDAVHAVVARLHGAAGKG